MSEIAGKVVAITGASSGIGEATAILLAARGARVVIGARRSAKLLALADRIVQSGGTAAPLAIYVKRQADLAAFVALAVERFGKLDVFVANAGIAPTSLLDDLRVADWEEIVDVNIKGFLYGIAAALPLFRSQGFGQFVNVLSTAGPIMRPTMAVYAGSKQAMRAIAEGLRMEAGDSLRVTNITPGFVHTDLAAATPDPQVRARILAQRDAMAISPEAIARAIAFAIEQPANVDVNEIVVRPTAQV